MVQLYAVWREVAGCSWDDQNVVEMMQDVVDMICDIVEMMWGAGESRGHEGWACESIDSSACGARMHSYMLLHHVILHNQYDSFWHLILHHVILHSVILYHKNLAKNLMCCISLFMILSLSPAYSRPECLWDTMFAVLRNEKSYPWHEAQCHPYMHDGFNKGCLPQGNIVKHQSNYRCHVFFAE